MNDHLKQKNQRSANSPEPEDPNTTTPANRSENDAEGDAREVSKRAFLTPNLDHCGIRINELVDVLCLPNGVGEDTAKIKLQEAAVTLLRMAPQDEHERHLLTLQMAAYHASLESYRRAGLPGQSPEVRDVSLTQAAKQAAIYGKLLSTLNKHRGNGQPNVTVERVNVESGGQAIVGAVNTNAPRSSSANRDAPRTHDEPRDVPNNEVQPAAAYSKPKAPR